MSHSGLNQRQAHLCDSYDNYENDDFEDLMGESETPYQEAPALSSQVNDYCRPGRGEDHRPCTAPPVRPDFAPFSATLPQTTEEEEMSELYEEEQEEAEAVVEPMIPCLDNDEAELCDATSGLDLSAKAAPRPPSLPGARATAMPHAAPILQEENPPMPLLM